MDYNFLTCNGASDKKSACWPKMPPIKTEPQVLWASRKLYL